MDEEREAPIEHLEAEETEGDEEQLERLGDAGSGSSIASTIYSSINS